MTTNNRPITERDARVMRATVARLTARLDAAKVTEAKPDGPVHQMGAALDQLIQKVEQARQQLAEQPTPTAPAPVTQDDRPYHALSNADWKAASAAYLDRVAGGKKSPIWRV